VKKILVSGIELTTANEREILGMAGPWIADVSIGDELLSKDCLLDNFVYNKYLHLLFFVKFNRISLYKYFRISFYNIAIKAVFEFDKEFDAIHLGEFVSKNELEIYPAFHDAFKSTRQLFNIDEEDFH
jgi:hypothetical protein